DALHRAGGVGVEPGVRVDLVALDGYQPAAGVRRADRDVDGVAGLVVVLVQGELQLGVALQRARQVRVAGHRVTHPVDLHAVTAAQDHQRVITGFVGGERV